MVNEIMRNVKTVLLTALVVAVACEAGTNARGGSLNVRDSAGVKLVHNTLPPGAEWQLDSTPVVVLDAKTDSARIREVAGLALLRDGSILVADRIDKSVRLFDTTGRLLRIVVREGDGPAELRAVSAIFVASHDTIFVHDAAAGVLLVLDPEARPVRKIGKLEFRSDSVRRLYGSPSLVGVFDDGSIATREIPFVWNDAQTTYGGPPAVSRPTPSHLGGEIVYRRGLPGDRVLTQYGSLMARATAAGAANSGSWGREVSAAFGDQFFFAPSDTLGFSVYSSDGRLRRVVTAGRPRTPMPLQDSVSREVALFRTYMPDVLTMVRASDGLIWLSSPTLGTSGIWSLRCYVFEPDGRLHASLETGEIFLVGAVRDNHVIGTSTGGSGEPTVVLRRLLR